MTLLFLKYRLFWINLIVLAIVLPGGHVFAQSQLSGRIFEYKTTTPINVITIENLNTHVKALSDKDGNFTIAAKQGELLSFSSSFYETDTLYLIDLKYRKVELRFKSSVLREVKVTSQEVKLRNYTYHSPSMFNNQTVLFNTDTAGHYLDGLRVMVHTYKGEEKKREKQEKFAANERDKDSIARLFSPENLKKYVPFTGQELTNFSILYTPDLKTYTDKGFNFLMYVADSYKKFKELPDSQRRSIGLTKLKPDAKIP